jgi:hypothetical protein
MGNGLIVSISKTVPTILDIEGKSVTITQGNDFRGQTTIQIKADKAVGITGAHLLQKAYWERDKALSELAELKKQYDFLINKRIEERNK